MSNTKTKTPKLRPTPVKIMTCPQLADAIRRHMTESASDFTKRQLLQLASLAKRLDNARTRAEKIDALDCTSAVSRLGTNHPSLVLIGKLAAKAARRLDVKAESHD